MPPCSPCPAASDQLRPSFTQRRLHQLQTCPHQLRSPTPSAPAWAWGVLPAWGPLWVCWTSPVSGWWFKICVMFISHAFNQNWRHQSLDYCDIIFPSLWDSFPWYHHPCWLQPPVVASWLLDMIGLSHADIAEYLSWSCLNYMLATNVDRWNPRPTCFV